MTEIVAWIKACDRTTQSFISHSSVPRCSGFPKVFFNSPSLPIFSIATVVVDLSTTTVNALQQPKRCKNCLILMVAFRAMTEVVKIYCLNVSQEGGQTVFHMPSLITKER